MEAIAIEVILNVECSVIVISHIPEEVHSRESLVDVRQLGGEAELAGLPGDVAEGVVLEVVVQRPGHTHPRAGLHPHPAPRQGHQRGQQPAPGPAVGRGHHNLEL